MEDYIKSELIGGVSSRHLNTFSNLLILFLAIRYSHRYSLYVVVVVVVVVVDCTHVLHLVQNIRTCHTMLLCGGQTK